MLCVAVFWGVTVCHCVQICRRFDSSTVVQIAVTFGAKLSKKSNLATRQGALCMCGWCASDGGGDGQSGIAIGVLVGVTY